MYYLLKQFMYPIITFIIAFCHWSMQILYTNLNIHTIYIYRYGYILTALSKSVFFFLIHILCILQHRLSLLFAVWKYTYCKLVLYYSVFVCSNCTEQEWILSMSYSTVSRCFLLLVYAHAHVINLYYFFFYSITILFNTYM